MRLLLAIPLLLVARAGPDTASTFSIAEPRCKVTVRTAPDTRPPVPELVIGFDLGNPGQSLKKPDVRVDGDQKRILVSLTVVQKEGAWPAVMTPTKTTAPIGALAKGRYVVEIRCDKRLLHAFVLDAR